MPITSYKALPQDSVDLLQLVRLGVTYALFSSIAAHSSFSLKEWGSILHLTERTLQRYKKEKKTFEQPYAERILEIAQLQQRGVEVFGSEENFELWLNSKIVALGGVQPKSLLDSSFGISLLQQELIRIEQGILA